MVWQPCSSFYHTSRSSAHWLTSNSRYVIPSQGGKPTRLTKSETNEFRPSWSHDGKWIYYCQTRTGHVQVWKIPASGGAEVQVTTNGGGVAFESVDGEDLY